MEIPIKKKKKTKNNKGRNPTTKVKRAKGIIGIMIDKKEFEKLASYHCTMSQIAGFFGCTLETLERWIKQTYNTDDTKAIYRRFADKGKALLVKTMLDEAIEERNTQMLIWTSKNLLGWKDKQETTVESDTIKIVASVEKEK